MRERERLLYGEMKGKGSVEELPDEAFHLFRQMFSSGVRPYEIAVTSAFGACLQLSALRLGKELHCFALKLTSWKTYLLVVPP